jgi:hypothetical protein
MAGWKKTLYEFAEGAFYGLICVLTGIGAMTVFFVIRLIIWSKP